MQFLMHTRENMQHICQENNIKINNYEPPPTQPKKQTITDKPWQLPECIPSCLIEADNHFFLCMLDKKV